MAKKKKTNAQSSEELFESGVIASGFEPVDAVKLAVNNFYEYGDMVNRDRAVPDIRDGLLTVQRRALVTAYDLNMTTSSLMGSAEFVGSAMRFHPHADTSLYDSVRLLTHKDRHPVPIFAFKGNSGSMTLGGAQLRYTSMRPNDATLAMLGHDDENSAKNEIDYKAVEIVKNYNNKYEEMAVLPAMIPSYLINGHEHGIGVGLRTDIPKHNPTEVLNLAAHLLKLGSPNIRTSTLLKLLPGPDFPTSREDSDTGIDIFDNPQDGIESYLTTGRGSFVMQAPYRLEEYAISKRDNGTKIIFEQLPYGVAPDEVREAFDKMVERGLIPDSIKCDVFKNVEVDIHKYEPEDVLPYLFSFTPLRKNYHAGMAANMPDGSVKFVSAVEAVMEWIEHRRRTIRNASRNKVAAWNGERENLEITLLAIEHARWITEVSLEEKEPAPLVAEKLEITQEQAQYILDKTTFTKLSQQRKLSIERKIDELEEKIDFHQQIVDDNDCLDAELGRQINAVKKKFGYSRKCTIRSFEEDLYRVRPKGPMVKEPPKKGFLAVGERGNIRWAFRDNIARELDDDYFTRLVSTTSADSIYTISNFGFVSRMAMKDAPREATSIEWHMVNSGYELDQGEEILSIFTSSEIAGKSIALLTDAGRIKVVSAAQYLDMRFGFKEALTIDLNKENHVIGACVFQEGDTVGALTSTGKFSMYEMVDGIYREKGTKARATSFIKLASRGGGELVWFGVVPDDAESFVYQNGSSFGRFAINRDEDIKDKVNVVGNSVSNVAEISWCRPVSGGVDTLCVASSDYESRVEVSLDELGEPSRNMKMSQLLTVDGSDELYATVYLAQRANDSEEMAV